MPRISRLEWFLRLRRGAKSFESGRAGWRLACESPLPVLRVPSRDVVGSRAGPSETADARRPTHEGIERTVQGTGKGELDWVGGTSSFLWRDEAESRGHIHQVGDRVGLHLSRHLASVRFNGDLADAELATDLFVQQT